MPKAQTDTTDKKAKFKGAAEITRDSGASVPKYEAIVEAPERIVMASAALQKRGKTSWAFTAPKPILYQQLDANYEHALKAARKKYGKDSIKHVSYTADPRGDLKSNARAEFERLIRDFDYGVDHFKTVIIDTASELLDIRKLAEWGRTTQIPQIYYGSFYRDMRWLVERGLKSNCNVILIHRLKDEYLNGERSGGYVLEGWKGVLFDAQVYVEHERDKDGNFVTNIIECAQDAMLMGASLTSEDDENDFAHLAQRIFPDSEEGDWE